MSKIIVYVTNACMSEVECYEYVMLSITEYSKMSVQFLININTVKTYVRLSLSTYNSPRPATAATYTQTNRLWAQASF